MADTFKVFCYCGKIWENVSADLFFGWPLAKRSVNGVCNCSSYFGG